MYQTVIITRMADRHADLVDRDFAQSYDIVVYAGPLSSILETLAESTSEFDLNLGVGRYSIQISEPFE